MMQALVLAAAGTCFTWFMTALGAAAVFFVPDGAGGIRLQKVMLGFAAGVMTAASVWSLLLPALAQMEADAVVPPWAGAAAGLLAGVVFLAALDGALPRLHRRLAEGEQRQSVLLMTAITLHNIPEGMAVGLAFALAAKHGGLAGAVALAVGIGVQNFPEGAAIALPLRRQGVSRRRAFGAGVLSGVVEPLFGVLVVTVAAGGYVILPWMLSFAAGAMLYVVVEELVPQAHSRSGTWGFVSGFLVMMALDTALG